MKKILILGASGFIGNSLYKELRSYFDTYGTYFTTRNGLEFNKKFFDYNIEEDDIFEILDCVQPDIIISALRGEFSAQVTAHQHMAEYVLRNDCKLFFISSANVFDSYSKYPSYEDDKTLSQSRFGHFKIKIENMLLRLPEEKMCIIRVPMVYGNASPRVKELNQSLIDKTPIEVFPNLVINVTHDDKLSQQIHYLINQNSSGVYHLGSTDLIHHEEFIHELVKRIGVEQPIYKHVFTTNEDRYLAVLPYKNRLPEDFEVTYEDIIKHHIIKQ